MRDLKTQILQLKRPKLLVNAARIGLVDYRRKPHLARILGGVVPSKTSAALMQLFDLENLHNRQRKTRDATYSAARHIDILIALIAESQRLSSQTS